MKELIKVRTNEEGGQVVSARELYMGLGLNKAAWSRWYRTNILQNEFFKENIDWIGVQHDVEGNLTMDFAISIEFAKHIAMMARTEKSHEYRNYFLELEKKVLNSQIGLPTNYLEALKQLVASEEEKQRLEQEKKMLLQEITHKEDVIISIAKDISLAEKQQRISQIIRFGAKGRFQERYNLLYSEFDKKYHIDSKRRLDNAIARGDIKKSVNRMEYICKHLGMAHELYEIAVKLFENDFKQLMETWEQIIA